MIDRGWFIWPIFLEFLIMMVNEFMKDIEKQTEKIFQTAIESIWITIGKYFG